MKELLSKVNSVDEPFVKEFCRRENVKLVSIDVTTENGSSEALYLFNDGLGGYTIQGVVDSLENLLGN